MKASGSIAIVGAGFSGTALAIGLLRRGAAPVALIERGGVFGPGLAYRTRCERHLLNVRSGRMSVFPDEADHFTRWLTGEGLDADPEGFARRADYGRYIRACLAEAQAAAPGRLALVTGEVTEIALEADGAVLRFADGRSLTAERAVLALGNPPPARLGLVGLDGLGGRYVPDPWAPDSLEAIGPEEDVVLVGTGLTAVDVLLALDARGWRGRAVAMSRRGLLPRTHGRRGEYGQGTVPKGPVSRQLREVRLRAERAPWIEVMDGLRPHGQALWRDASPAERRRFLRHLRPWWDVHRHRMAPEIGAQVERWIVEERLRLSAGRLLQVEPVEGGARVVWRSKTGAEQSHYWPHWVINCTGPQGDPSRAREPLLDALLAGGVVRTDPLRLGLDVDGDGRVLDGEGRPQPWLWAMGPLTRGALWEIVAVPEIRVQAQRLVEHLAPAATSQAAALAHLEDVGQTYAEHMAVAFAFGARMMGAGAACMIHGLAPWWFTKTASRTVTKLHAEMIAARAKPPE